MVTLVSPYRLSSLFEVARIFHVPTAEGFARESAPAADSVIPVGIGDTTSPDAFLSDHVTAGAALPSAALTVNVLLLVVAVALVPIVKVELAGEITKPLNSTVTIVVPYMVGFAVKAARTIKDVAVSFVATVRSPPAVMDVPAPPPVTVHVTGSSVLAVNCVILPRRMVGSEGLIVKRVAGFTVISKIFV